MSSVTKDAMVNKDALITLLLGYGMMDPEVFSAMGFTDAEDLLRALYPGSSTVSLSADAIQFLDVFVGEAAARATLARRLDERGITPSLGDALWATGVRRRKAEEALSLDLAAAHSSAGPRLSGTPSAWRPAKKIRRMQSLEGADDALMKRWGSRLGAILKNGCAPAWLLAQSSSDPAAALAGLVGRARPSTVAKRVRGWEVFSRWLLWNRGYSWPSSPVDIVDYFHRGLLALGAGVSAFSSALDRGSQRARTRRLFRQARVRAEERRPRRRLGPHRGRRGLEGTPFPGRGDRGP